MGTNIIITIQSILMPVPNVYSGLRRILNMVTTASTSHNALRRNAGIPVIAGIKIYIILKINMLQLRPSLLSAAATWHNTILFD